MTDKIIELIMLNLQKGGVIINSYIKYSKVKNRLKREIKILINKQILLGLTYSEFKRLEKTSKDLIKLTWDDELK